jgi:hypothetical protein
MALDALKVLYRAGRTKTQQLINDHKELIGWIAAGLVLATVIIVFGWSIRADKASCWYRVGQGLAIFWAVAPPVYFFLEWWFWAPKNADADLDERKFEFEKFRSSRRQTSPTHMSMTATSGQGAVCIRLMSRGS